jgi:hypothetical protein
VEDTAVTTQSIVAWTVVLFISLVGAWVLLEFVFGQAWLWLKITSLLIWEKCFPKKPRTERRKHPRK